MNKRSTMSTASMAVIRADGARNRRAYGRLEIAGLKLYLQADKVILQRKRFVLEALVDYHPVLLK